MQITYLHQYFNTPSMPGSVRSFELARRLVDRGHEVHVLTSWRDPDRSGSWFETDEAGIRVHWLPVEYSNSMSHFARVRAFLKFATAASNRASGIASDVIYATSTPLTIAIPGAWAAFRRGIPMVFEVRDLWPDVPVAMGVLKSWPLVFAARRLETFAYRRAHSIVALTPSMRDFLSGKGVPLEKTAVIPNGANAADFDAAGVAAKPTGQRILLYCGSLGPAHGPEYLCSLAKEFLTQELNVRIRVAGEGRLGPELKAQAAADATLDKTIEFFGSIPHAEVPRLYREAHASIMTIADVELLYRHSVQNKFFDSLAASLPVFSNYSGWASELAESRNAGLVVSRKDVAGSARLIAERMSDSGWLQSAGQSARGLFDERFEFDHLAETLESVLHRTVSECTGP